MVLYNFVMSVTSQNHPTVLQSAEGAGAIALTPRSRVLRFSVWGWIWRIVLFISVFVALSLIAAIINFLIESAFPTNPLVHDQLFLLFLLALPGVGILLFARLLFGLRLSEMWMPRGRHGFLSLFYGLLLGFAAVTVLVGVGVATGSLTLEFQHLGLLTFLFLLGFIVQGSQEEFLVRAVLTRLIYRPGKRYTVALAVLLPSCIFAALHLTNPGTTFISQLNTLLAGVTLALLMLAFDNIYISCGFHGAWNWALAPFYGTPVSGIVIHNTTFQTQVNNEQLVGSTYGFEGSILCTVLLVLLCIPLWIKAEQRERSFAAQTMG